jgi:uncharacterized NAD(P)/FAD-binding protein YdhS
MRAAGKIANVGGGFSGTPMLFHLAALLPAGCGVELFEARAVAFAP